MNCTITTQPMRPEEVRSEVRRRLAKHPDRKFRRAVFALQQPGRFAAD